MSSKIKQMASKIKKLEAGENKNDRERSPKVK